MSSSFEQAAAARAAADERDKQSWLRQLSKGSSKSNLAAEHVALDYSTRGTDDCKEPLMSECAASINLTKNLVGSGIFTLPLALSKASVIPGLLMMVWIGSLCGGSFILIAYLCKALGCGTYRDMCAKSLGQAPALFVDIGIMLNGIFGCLSYVILVCDFFEESLPPLVHLHPSRWSIILVDTVLIILPLSHIKDLSPLRIPSLIGMVIISYIFAYLIADWAGQFDVSISNFESGLAKCDVGLFFAASVFTGAFKAHYNAPTFYRELGEDIGAHSRVVKKAYVSSFVIYALFAVAGYGIFGSGVEGNILKNYASEDGMSFAILVALLGMAFAITLSYPLVFNSGRAAFYGLFPSLERARERNPAKVHIALTTSMVATISLMACFVRNVQIVVGLTGATIGMALCFILPSLVYFKLAFSTDRKSVV